LTLSENAGPTGGQIDLCPHQGCGFACCDFAAGNFIALYPGEFEEARSSGASLQHLRCSPDGQGGYRAICQAKQTATCDGGYKPLDCACYPFFPTINDTSGRIQAGLKGEKCPLQARHLADHRQWVLQRWQSLMQTVPGLVDWIRGTRLVGYVRDRGNANNEC
jgi:hypothetical protein